MNDARRRAIEDLFERALEVDPGRRSAWLARATGSDRTLRAEVEALLAGHARRGGVLERAAPLRRAAAALVLRPPVLPGARLGRYRIVKEIGRGGMSTVYLAERADGQFERTVALKIGRAEADDDDLRRRLLTERQILAALDHPHIARLLDGGLTEDGRPYLVMEYVDGIPIDVQCDRARLTVAQRLRLFCDVARAVEHAHRNLVVHRDLKPSNVLVTPEGGPRLLDFGIAKILSPGPAGTPSTVTRRGLLPMTPEYASPEQVRGRKLTTASDVYSLGVVLYELLSGRRPYDLADDSPGEVVEAICGREPEAPSQRVRQPGGFVCLTGRRTAAEPGDVAAVRGSTPERLERRLRGDLDAIALKALRKEADERYGSAEQLARDIERHLQGFPVGAHRGDRLYRARKLVRRHRGRTAAVAGIFLSLVLGAGSAAWQAAERRRERDAAREARDLSRSVTRALAGMLETGDPWSPGFRGTTTARALLDLGLARVASLEGQPAVQAGLLDILARAHATGGELERAETLATRSLALRREALGEDHPEVAASLNVLGDVLRRQGRYRLSERMHREALEIQRRALGPDHPEVAETLTELARQLSGPRLAEVEDLYERALEIRRTAFGPEHPLVATSLMNLGRIRRSRGLPGEAEAAYREALEIRRKSLGHQHPDVAKTLVFLADLLREYGGSPARAEALYRSALEMQGRVLGEHHPVRMHGLGSLATLLSNQGRHEEAERVLREALLLRRATFGPRHQATAEGMDHLADELHRQGRLAEAERLRRDALAIWREAVGPDHWAVSGSLMKLADVLVDGGRFDEAETLCREALEMRRRAMGDDHPGVGLALASLGHLHTLRGDFARAESLYRRALELVRRERTDRHVDVRRLHGELGELYAAWGRPTEAREYGLLADAGRER